MLKKIFDRISKQFDVDFRLKLIVVILIFLYALLLNIYFGLPEYGIYHQLMIVLSLLGIWMILPKLIDRIFLFITMLIYGLYVLGQIVFYRGFQTYFYIEYAFSMRNEVVGVMSSVFELIKLNDYLVLALYFVIWGMITFIFYKIKLKHRFSFYINILVGVTLFALTTFFNMSFQKQLSATDVDSFTYNESDRYLYDVIPSPEAYVIKFGVNAFLMNDLYNVVIKPVLQDHSEKQAAIEAYLLSREYDQTINNAYTGVLADRNLIIIQGESLTNMGIDPTLTPTLYKIYQEGVSFENFDAPLLPGSTSDTEIMIQNSLYPVTGGFATMHAYAYNNYPVTLAKLFKTNDYQTDIYHNNYGTYYNRDVFYGNDAYDMFFEPVEMGLENMCSDYEMLNHASWIIAEKDRFYSYIIAYSGHQPYNFISVEDPTMSRNAYDEYMGYVKEIELVYPDLNEFAKSYLAKCMSLDRGVEKLLYALEAYGRLDNTTIVLFGDHMIKGYDEAENVDTLATLNIEKVTIPLIIWDKNLEPTVVEKYANSLDVLPTLMNMFNIDYDRTKVFGYDIFDEDYIGFYFTVNGTVISKDFVYSYIDGLTIKNDMTSEEAMYWVNDFRKTMEISSYIIETDHFAKR
ncbi:MAG: sulfatase-like hydrolase/transferase [Erysipelotrichaceae bacterium]|nr:sulfatase-like hydrolase/transferase [Erysipelotrichaceae bacterium]